MRVLTKLATVAIISVAGWSYGQQPQNDKATVEKLASTAGRSLEEMLKDFVSSHPDVQVAEAKVKEAEAELRRTRVGLAQKLIERHAAVDSQRVIVKILQAEYEMYQKLFQRQTGSESDVRRALAQLERAKADLAQSEAAL